MPGVFESLGRVCPGLRGHLVPGAGHWVQQEEQAAAVTGLLLEFLASL